MDTGTAQHYRHPDQPKGPIVPAESCEAIAERMEALAIELRSLSDEEMQAVPTDATLFTLAAKLYAARRKVDEIFDMTGFSVSPGWDIMLDLYQARAKGSQISVTSASIGAACPATTALRWLHALENMQLIERSQDPEDRRRTCISLTEKGWLRTADALRCHLKS